MTRIMRIGLCATVAAFAGCADFFTMIGQAAPGLVEKPHLSMKHVDVTGFDAPSLALSTSFLIGVQNPNPVGLPLSRLDYDLAIDGRQLADGHAQENVSLPANGSTDVTLPVNVRLLDAGLTIEQLATRSSLPYQIRVRLGFDTPGGTLEVPLEQSGTFALASLLPSSPMQWLPH